MERADDMVEVVVGAVFLVFTIDLFASGIEDLEGNACDFRLRGGDAQGALAFWSGVIEMSRPVKVTFTVVGSSSVAVVASSSEEQEKRAVRERNRSAWVILIVLNFNCR